MTGWLAHIETEGAAGRQAVPTPFRTHNFSKFPHALLPQEICDFRSCLTPSTHG